jgi:uncharacterized hydrophobic protein (TIGR00271 family)
MRMSKASKIYLIYSPGVEEQLALVIEHPIVVEQEIDIRKVKLAEMSSIHVHDDLGHALLWIEQADYPLALQLAYQKKISLGFLPIAGDPLSRFIKNLELPTGFNDCLEQALHEEPFAMDLIECNGEIVTDGVNLVNQTTMAEFIGDSYKYKGIHKIEFQLKRFFHAFSLTPHPVTLITDKGKTVSTAITGMLLLDFHKSGPILKLFKDSVSLRDRRISIALFAPQSILSYLQLSSSAFLSSQKREVFQQIGYIRTESLLIKTSVDTHYLVNDVPLTTRELQLKTFSEGLYVNAGKAFRERQSFGDDKENVSCDQLPQQEDRVKYLSNTLPFFSHALESDFKELFLNLKDAARLNSTYVLLMVLSSLLATLGLFLNSPSIVIGAMVLAPLMSPIISLSMGILRSDAELSRKSFSTLFVGMLIALLLSALMAYLLPFQEVTNEIEGRLHPSTLDLLVAVLSGVAGAFANARENIAKSLPGVAIAVALVPPLCVSGIGLGWLNVEIFSGAMLLFLTNLTGIIMAAGLSFMVMGFAPFLRAKKGIVLSIVLVAIISVPLVFSFKNMQKMADIKQQLLSQNYDISGQKIQLRNIKIRYGTPIRVSADLLSTQIPSAALLSLFEQQLSDKIKQALKVDFSIHLVTESHF